MKRILIVCGNGFENAGVQQVIMTICRGLHQECTFDAIVFSEGNQYYTEEFLNYGNIYHFPPRYKGNKVLHNIDEFTRLFKYKKLINKFLEEHGDYDVIHCHNPFESAVFLEAAANHGIPIRVVHSHNPASNHVRKNPLYKYLRAFLCKKLNTYATHRIACSKAAGDFMFPGKKYQIVYNAIDLSRYNQDTYKTVSSNKIRFIHVGRYSNQKNQFFLIDVFSAYKKINENSTLTLIGFGELEEKIRDKIERCSLQDSVHMLPSDTNVAQELAQADLFVFPSMYEGLGITLIEAQAMGLHCFISDKIPPEADLGACTRIHLDAGPEEWARQIDLYIRQNGVDKVKVDMSAYDAKNIVEEYTQIYQLQGREV